MQSFWAAFWPLKYDYSIKILIPHIARFHCNEEQQFESKEYRITRSPLEPWVLRPGAPLQPVAGVAEAAAEACSGPCASPRQREVGTHARGPG